MSRGLKELKKSAKFLHYVLTISPDEFGLIPDQNGYYRLKELLQALQEDPHGKKIRKGRLNEISMSLSDPPFEISSNLVRPRDASRLPSLAKELNPPKLLYTAVRRRAYPHVSAKGLTQGAQPGIVLSADKDLALRIGRRKDPQPVLLTVNTAQARKLDTTFQRFGKLLFVADKIPPGCFSGPPLPKHKPGKPAGAAAKPKRPAEAAGSFLLDTEHLEKKQQYLKSTGRRKDPEWKRYRRKARKR